MSLPKHYEKMDYEINGHKLFISKLKLHKAHQSKCHQKVINIHNGKIAKRIAIRSVE